MNIGDKYNKLTIISILPSVKGYRFCEVICECGNIKKLYSDNVVSGKTKSCGCFHKSQTSKSRKTHGESRSLTYVVWEGIKNRCLNKLTPSYINYGGRGITICDEWLDYTCFLKDMGERISKDYSIDRIDNNLGYFKDNCKWSTRTEQNRNRRNNVEVLNVDYGIIYGSVPEAAESIDKTVGYLSRRINGGVKNNTNLIRI